MKRVFRGILATTVLCLSAVGLSSCEWTQVSAHKTTTFPQRPMVYPLSLKLMDVNWIDQELGRIPLLIEEKREGELITDVRVQPMGDIRLPGLGSDDIAFRWHVESCNATRGNQPYTLVLKLTKCRYPGKEVQTIVGRNTITTIEYDVYGQETYARVLVHRAADGSFSMSLKNDIISGIGETCSISVNSILVKSVGEVYTFTFMTRTANTTNIPATIIASIAI